MTVCEFIVELRWALVVLIILLVFGRRLVSLVEKYSHVEVSSKAINVTLKNLKNDYNVSKVQIKKLHGLTGHDLWALEAFVNHSDEGFKCVPRFTAQRKAIAYSFVEMGLLEIFTENGVRCVRPTELATQVLEAADKLM